MVRKIRNKRNLILFLTILFILFICIALRSNKLSLFDAASNKKFDSSVTLNDQNVKKVIQEVEKAYYNRGLSGQYCSYRRAWINPPESATSQHRGYTVCSNFAFNIYYEAFGIHVPSITQLIFGYGQAYYIANNITTNDVVEFWIRDDNGNYIDNKDKAKNPSMDLSTAAGRTAYANWLLTGCNLQTGDILCYGNKLTGTGHTMVVYDIEYDSNNNPVDAIFMDAESHGDDYKTTKLTKEELLYRSVVKSSTFTEGVIRYRRLMTDEGSISALTTLLNPQASNSRSYLVILRPLLKNTDGEYTGKYYMPGDYNGSTYVYTSRTLTDYSVTDNSAQRIQYPDLYIEKTVDVFDNSVVEPGDTITYTIEIKNNSGTQYTDKVYVVENYDKDKVQNIQLLGDYAQNGTIDEQNATITWNAGRITNKRILTYSVTLKNDYNLLGEELISTGTVAGIPSATITNKIDNNLTNAEKTSIKTNLQSLLSKTNKPKGVALIDKLYSDLGYDFKLGADTSTNQAAFDITNLIKIRSKSTYSTDTPAVYLNSQNEKYGVILSNHYSAVYNKLDDNNAVTAVELKRWEGYSFFGSRDQRADSLYMENFQTGDVLVYKNEQTAVSGKSYRSESGTYYLVFISEADKITVGGVEKYGFIGVDSDGTINNIYGNDSETFTANDLRTIFGKDYYVIFRPSIGFDVTPPEIQVTYSTEQLTRDSVIVTLTSNEEIQDISGWTEQTAGFVYAKEYTANMTENIEVRDLAGNETIVNVEINNIYTKGDLNENGQIDIGDLLLIYRHMAQNNSTQTAQNHPDWKLSDQKIQQGDLNNNNQLDLGDCLRIQRYLAAHNSTSVANEHPDWLVIE